MVLKWHACCTNLHNIYDIPLYLSHTLLYTLYLVLSQKNV